MRPPAACFAWVLLDNPHTFSEWDGDLGPSCTVSATARVSFLSFRSAATSCTIACILSGGNEAMLSFWIRLEGRGMFGSQIWMV
jgi:hypothetical protein